MPGFGVLTTGACVRASEAAAQVGVTVSRQDLDLSWPDFHSEWDAPIVFSLLAGVGVDVPDGAANWFFSSLSGVMVDVDVEREKVLVKGPKWVSFNSGTKIVSQAFHHEAKRRGKRTFGKFPRHAGHNGFCRRRSRQTGERAEKRNRAA